MPITLPSELALKEFLSSSTHHIRRIEIYEADGETRWDTDEVNRLKSGSVTVDANRDERRSVEVVLNNSDGGLENRPGALWYDKIIKVYRGVRIFDSPTLPRVLVVGNIETGAASLFRETMIDLGMGNIRIKSNAALSDTADYDVIVGIGVTDANVNLLNSAFNNGKSIVVLGWNLASLTNTPYPTSTPTLTEEIGPTSLVQPVPAPHAVARGWSAFDYSFLEEPAGTFSFVSSAAPIFSGYTPLARSEEGSIFLDAIAREDARWVTFAPPARLRLFEEEQFRMMLLSIFRWVNPVVQVTEWETQIGEFMIDRIVEPNFPHEIHITGRDYSKKGMGSKFPHATQFNKGQRLENVIAAIAGSAGITKRMLPNTGIQIGRDFVFDRNVSRWEAMKELATAYNYELYFDATGYLIMREFRDPVDSPPVVVIRTGPGGQVASYQKSSSDTQIRNSVLVVGESSDPDVAPKWAVARNENPDSPTNIATIGERSTEFTSSLIETTAQAQELANSILAVSALEEFELSFESLMLPWLEVGDIMGWEDPSEAYSGPTTFLLSNITIPLSLGPMSANGRRVLNVG